MRELAPAFDSSHKDATKAAARCRTSKGSNQICSNESCFFVDDLHNALYSHSSGSHAKSNRPPVDNDSGMRELTPEEITPNLNYYAMDPLYDPDAVLGWAGTRVEEKINRGMLALNIGDGSVYLGWRLLKSDPEDVAFNVYRSNAGGPAIGLNGSPLTGTTDFIDDGLLPRHKIVQVYNQGSGATRGQPFSQTIVEIFSSESGLPGSRCAR